MQTMRGRGKRIGENGTKKMRKGNDDNIRAEK